MSPETSTAALSRRTQGRGGEPRAGAKDAMEHAPRCRRSLNCSRTTADGDRRKMPSTSKPAGAPGAGARPPTQPRQAAETEQHRQVRSGPLRRFVAMCVSLPAGRGRTPQARWPCPWERAALVLRPIVGRVRGQPGFLVAAKWDAYLGLVAAVGFPHVLRNVELVQAHVDRELVEAVHVDDLFHKLGAVRRVADQIHGGAGFQQGHELQGQGGRGPHLMNHSANDISSLWKNVGWTTYRFFKFFLYLSGWRDERGVRERERERERC